MDGSKKDCNRDTCPGFKKANKETNDDKENENEQRQQQQQQQQPQAKKRCNYDVCPSMKTDGSAQQMNAEPSTETATCASYKDEHGKPCCGRCPRPYQEQARGQPMQADASVRAQSMQTDLSQMSGDVPKNSTQILFYDSTFMDAPSEYDVFFDCYSDFDIPKTGAILRQRNRCLRNAQRFDEQKMIRHCSKAQKRLMTQQSMSSNMPQLHCSSNATSQYQPCTCHQQHQQHQQHQRQQQHHHHHHYAQQRQMPNSGYGDGSAGGGTFLRDNIKPKQLDSKSMRNDSHRCAHHQQQPQQQQQQQQHQQLQHQCPRQNYQQQQQQQAQQQQQHAQQQQQHRHHQPHQSQHSQQLQQSYSTSCQPSYAGPTNSSFLGSFGNEQPSYSQRPCHSAQHSTNIPLGISARVATDCTNLSQQITLNQNSMNMEPISFTVPLQIQLQFPIPPQYANWTGRTKTNVEPIRTATVSAATPPPNNSGKGISIDEKKSKPYIPFTTPLIQSDTYLCDCKSPLEVTEPVPVPTPIPLPIPIPEPEPEPEEKPKPVPVLETDSEPETEDSVKTIEELPEPRSEKFEELTQTTESDEPKPIPPPKPDAKKYRLALPQHRYLDTCSPCRYDPSPLIDENGRVFCPGRCGCCLCAWRERANIELEDRLRHSKLKVCKCVEKGTIFTDFSLVDPHCSKTSFFDVCPCREKAEAVFLELYGHEMWSPDDKMSRKMTGDEVYLWECKEIKEDDLASLNIKNVGILDDVEIRRIDSILSGASEDELAILGEQADDDVGKSMK